MGWDKHDNGRPLRKAIGKGVNYWSAAVLENNSSSDWGKFLKIFLDAEKNNKKPTVKTQPHKILNATPIVSPHKLKSAESLKRDIDNQDEKAELNIKTDGKFEHQRGKLIGRGAFGEVYKCILIKSGNFAAMKVIPTDNLKKSQVDSIMNEVSLLEQLNHPFIIPYIGIEHTNKKLHIFMELAESSLKDMIQEIGKFEEKLIRVYVSQILKGLSYLHRNKVIHRDIKSDNILLGKIKGDNTHLMNDVMKLGDFGCSKLIEFQEGKEKSAIGTPYYLAPEVVDPDEPGYDFKADIWSMGCVVVEMVTGQVPWKGLTPFQAIYKVGTEGKAPPYPEDKVSES
eukprot:UN22569